MQPTLPASTLASPPGPPRTRRGKAGGEVTTPSIERVSNLYAGMTLDHILYEHSEKLAAKLVDRALGDDMQAMKICMDKLVPNATHRRIAMDLPSIESSQDAVSAVKKVIELAAAGIITLDSAKVMTDMLDKLRESMKQESDIQEWKDSIERLQQKVSGVLINE